MSEKPAKEEPTKIRYVCLGCGQNYCVLTCLGISQLPIECPIDKSKIAKWKCPQPNPKMEQLIGLMTDSAAKLIAKKLGENTARKELEKTESVRTIQN